MLKSSRAETASSTKNKHSGKSRALPVVTLLRDAAQGPSQTSLLLSPLGQDGRTLQRANKIKFIQQRHSKLFTDTTYMLVPQSNNWAFGTEAECK